MLFFDLNGIKLLDAFNGYFQFNDNDIEFYWWFPA